MIEQVRHAIEFEAFFLAGKVGATGLTITVEIELPDGSLLAGDLLLSDGSTLSLVATPSLLPGWFVFQLPGELVTLPGRYRALFHTDDGTVAQQDIPSLVWVGLGGIAHLDADVSAAVQAVQSLPTPVTADELLNAQVAIISGVPIPDNAGISTIKTTVSDVHTLATEAVQGIAGLPNAGTIATAVWGAANRTLSSFGTLVEQIASTITAIFTAPTSRPPSSSSRRSLADAVANDVYTFLNASEFGRVRNVNGSMILCVLMKNSLHPSGGAIDAGMTDDQWTLQCATADMPCQPMTTERLRVDNVLYLVDESADNQGMMTVKMTNTTV